MTDEGGGKGSAGGEGGTDGRSGTERATDDVTGRSVGDHPVRGVAVDRETRCTHWGGDRDVIAIRAPCCEAYYPCAACHEARADHPLEPIPEAAFDDLGVLCGVCATALTVSEYLEADHECPVCGASFNPRCVAHYDRYFEGFD